MVILFSLPPGHTGTLPPGRRIWWAPGGTVFELVLRVSLVGGPQLVRYPTADTTVAPGARPSTLVGFNLDSQFVKSQLVIYFSGCGATSPDFHEM